VNLGLSSNQFKLIIQKRFGPFLGTQFLGACNDNLFKFAVTLLITYQWHVSWLPPALAGLAIGAIFILPFLLFSAFSGLLADHFNKTRILQTVKLVELGIMGVAYYGFNHRSALLLLFCIFLMGLHSTLFGPAKYAYLPSHIHREELMGANAVVEAGTFLAILMGNLIGGILISNQLSISTFINFSLPEQFVAFCCLGLSVAGLVISLFIPDSPLAPVVGEPTPQIDLKEYLLRGLNPWKQTIHSLRQSEQTEGMGAALYGISWMWFYGAVFLSLFPSFSKDLLHGNSDVASLLLVVFSIGIGIGSLLCNSLRDPQYELSLVFLGLFGMTIFTLDLAFIVNTQAYGGSLFEVKVPAYLTHIAALPLITLNDFLFNPGNLHVLVDLGFLSAFIGIFSVPLYTFIQTHSPSDKISQTVAANNILNSAFMICSALLVGTILTLGLTIAQVFLLLGLSNIPFLILLDFKLPVLKIHFFKWIQKIIVNFKNPF